MAKSSRHTLNLTLIAIFSALLTGGKMALMAIPNVEIVTLVIILISCVFGLTIALPVTLIFVTVEMLIFGFNYWVISYYIYWPLLAVEAYLITRKERPAIVTSIFAAVMTFLFGVITSGVDALLAGGLNIGFFRVFGFYYARGIMFFAAHIASNFIIVLALFIPLRKALMRLKTPLVKEENNNNT